jgi:hypothetical protein
MFVYAAVVLHYVSCRQVLGQNIRERAKVTWQTGSERGLREAVGMSAVELFAAPSDEGLLCTKVLRICAQLVPKTFVKFEQGGTLAFVWLECFGTPRRRAAVTLRKK